MCDSRRASLLCPVAALLIADVGLTLAGQPAAYWSGNYAIAIEDNPVVRPFLAHSPGAFVVVVTIWLSVLSAVILWWPPWAWGWRVAMVVAGIASLAHAVASASWLARPGGWGWLMAVTYLVITAELSWLCWRRVGGVHRTSRRS